jgi:tetratricopeptide (TPR) repeat protein
MNVVQPCGMCGAALNPDGRCPQCALQLESQFVHRELIVLIVLIGIAVAAFFATRAVATANRRLHVRDAQAWFDREQSAARAGRFIEAIDAAHRAVAQDPDARVYRLALADALVAGARADEAERVLLSLRRDAPEDAEANLRLARIAAERSDGGLAARYYRAALAAFEPSDMAVRDRVRLEFARFLLGRGDRNQALAELVVLSGTLPHDSNDRLDVGHLYLRAGDSVRAAEEFASVLRAQPNHAEALAGAGQAAFARGDYAAARRYLTATTVASREVIALRDLVALIVANDPLARRIGTRERVRRLTAGIDAAVVLLDQCRMRQPTQDDDTSIVALETEARAAEGRWTSGGSRPTLDDVEEGMELIVRIERTIMDVCQAPVGPMHRALLLIAKQHGLDDRR